MPKSKHRKKKKFGSRLIFDPRKSLMRQAAKFPLFECRINEDWKTHQLASITFARSRPDGLLAVAAFAVDLGCLGIKSAFGSDAVTASKYQSRFVDVEHTRQVPFDPACAVKMILGAFEYAKQLGFKPDPDYFFAREIFGDINPEECDESFEYGRNGKPFYVAGPYDDVDRIMNKLSMKLGEGGFDWLIPFGSEDAFEIFEDDEEDD